MQNFTIQSDQMGTLTFHFVEQNGRKKIGEGVNDDSLHF